MLSYLILLVLVVLGVYFLYKSYDKETGTFNWSLGVASVGGLGAVVWGWFSGLFG